MTYDNWRARLDIAQKYSTVAERRAAVAALKINFSQPGEADCGYYRKPVTEKHATNGSNIIKGWVPVSYFMHGDKLVGIIGAGGEARDMTDDEVTSEELWSWVVSNPITYELYQGVVEYGEDWPDLRDPIIQAVMERESVPQKSPAPLAGQPQQMAIPAANRDVAKDDNKPPELLPHVEHGTAIDNAIGAGKDLPVTTVAEAALAAGAANLIRDRRLAAEKVAKVKVEPLKVAYETERGNWLPMVQRAKVAEDGLRKKVSNFEADERKRIAKEQQDALDRQREQDEANARAADRAIGAGEPEPPPVVDEVVIPQAPPPITPTYGGYRPAAKQVKKFAVITDAVAVYKYLATVREVQDLLQKLATNAIRAGLEVPGTTTREGTE